MEPVSILLSLVMALASSPATGQCGGGQDENGVFWSLDSGECLNVAFPPQFVVGVMDPSPGIFISLHRR